jgi:hypothetical protein
MYSADPPAAVVHGLTFHACFVGTSLRSIPAWPQMHQALLLELEHDRNATMFSSVRAARVCFGYFLGGRTLGRRWQR